jgi:two-component system phosphate regulon sensor histidine kinase PhoR
MKQISKTSLPILLLVTILAITGFQLFWLMENYQRERSILRDNVHGIFQQAVYGLQASQLKKRFNITDTVLTTDISGNKRNIVRHFNNGDEVVGMVNILRDEVKDSAGKIRSRTVSSRNGKLETIVFKSDDSLMNGTVDKFEVNNITITKDPIKASKFVQLLTGIDAARDTLSLNDIAKATDKALMAKGIRIPFTLAKHDGRLSDSLSYAEFEVAVGFSDPVAYMLKMGNTSAYLMKRISSPLLFSLFLITVTFASFIILYRTLREQQKLAKLKNDFISNVTHELKTPIATVNVALEALKSFNALNDPQKTRDYLDISQQELQRLSLLVDKVLRISMFENSQVELKTEDFDLLSLVNEVRASMRLQFEKYHATVNVITVGQDFTIHADKLHIMSVIYNLFDNALKYGKDDPQIEVAITDKASSLQISFRDNGIGIPPQYREKVFEKFFRVPKGDVHDVKGYGLGLSYVAHIIGKHKGNISVESIEGKGSNFIINLPRHA